MSAVDGYSLHNRITSEVPAALFFFFRRPIAIDNAFVRDAGRGDSEHLFCQVQGTLTRRDVQIDDWNRKSEVLQELSAEKMEHILRIALFAIILCESNSRIADMFQTVSVTRDTSLKYTIAGCYFHLN